MNIVGCSVVEKGSIVSRSENKSSFSIVNKNRRPIRVIKIDGCVYGQGEKKCDYAFQSEGGYTCLVELKGKNVEGAVKQLDATLGSIDKEFLKGRLYCFVVLSRYPKSSPSVQLLQKKFKKKNVIFKPHSIKYSVDNEKLIAGDI